MWSKLRSRQTDLYKQLLVATQEYKAEMDLLAAFCEACIEIDYVHGDRIAATDLFSVYSNWAATNNEFMMSSRKFFNEVTKKLPEKQRASSGMFYTKIRLTEYAKTLLNKTKNYKITDFT